MLLFFTDNQLIIAIILQGLGVVIMCCVSFVTECIVIKYLKMGSCSFRSSMPRGFVF